MLAHSTNGRVTQNICTCDAGKYPADGDVCPNYCSSTVACYFRSWQCRWTCLNWSWSFNRRSRNLESFEKEAQFCQKRGGKKTNIQWPLMVCGHIPVIVRFCTWHCSQQHARGNLLLWVLIFTIKTWRRRLLSKTSPVLGESSSRLCLQIKST